MKQLLIIFTLACGIKPIAPVECFRGQAVCICDDDGDNCEWVWVNC